MKRVFILIITVIFINAGLAGAEGKAHWGYSGKQGPSHWGDLSKEFALCGEGKNQSPVNLAGMIEADLADIKFAYENTPLEVENNGHTIKVPYAEGSSITINGQTFNLLQFHFHSPSENQIEGKSYAMEAHLVHADENGNLAVIAVMFTKGSENKTLSPVWKIMPAKAGKTNTDPAAMINVMDMLPENKSYYRFNGSLTTPPCTEGVFWFVLTDAVTASPKQLDIFRSVMHHDNNRPVQRVNARPLLKMK